LDAAFRNDPLTEVSIVANNFTRTFRRTRRLRARLVLMRQLTRLYYGSLGFRLFAATRRTAPDNGLTAPSPDEFRAAIASGAFTPASPETPYVLGKMFLAGFLSCLADPRRRESPQAGRPVPVLYLDPGFTADLANQARRIPQIV
jgi:hypothetical protein